MRRNKEELMKIVGEYVGGREDDATIALMEDISDSIGDSSDYDELKAKFDDLSVKYDADISDWRRRYKERFYGGDSSDENSTEGNREEASSEFRTNVVESEVEDKAEADLNRLVDEVERSAYGN